MSDERIEYGWVEADADGNPVIVKRERRRPLRTEPVEVAPAETIAAELPYKHPDGRRGTLRGTVDLPATVEPAEVKRGADGHPQARPIVEEPKPEISASQRLAGPFERIEPETITRYWEVEDRPLAEVRAWKAAEIKSEMSSRIADRLLEADDAGDIRAAGRAALAAVAAAATWQEVSAVTVEWPASERPAAPLGAS